VADDFGEALTLRSAAIVPCPRAPLAQHDRRTGVREEVVVANRRSLASLLSLWLLSACVAAVDDDALESAGQSLAAGTLGPGDVYSVSASAGASGARMYIMASSPFVLRQLAPQAAVQVLSGRRANGRYRVEHAGARGWVAAADLTLAHTASDPALGCARLAALAGARAAMGFSYWWSNARWPVAGGATTWPVSNVGVCSGSCGGTPGCTHIASGDTEYGADCSGFVSTIWGFPDADPTTNPTNNGFGTVAYNQDTARWATLGNEGALPADAMVQYVTGGTKHIFLVASGRNAAGRITTYECRSCALGCMTNSRDLASASGWHAIRRMSPAWDDELGTAACEGVAP
jgi:hypothetical protein